MLWFAIGFIPLSFPFPPLNFTTCAVVILSILDKVHPQMQGVQSEVVPVAPSGQSAPVAPPQVYAVLHVLMSLKSNFTSHGKYSLTSG